MYRFCPLFAASRLFQAVEPWHLGIDEALQCFFGQALERERKRIEFVVPGQHLAAEIDRRAQQHEHVLNRQQMPHLFPGDRENAGAPAFDYRPVVFGSLVSVDGIGGIEILHHQRMLYLRARGEHHHEMIARRHVRSLEVVQRT